MAAVGQGDPVAMELADDGGHELLLADHPGQRLVDRAGELGHVGRGERGRPEGAQHRGRGLHRLETLPAHVADDDPDAERRRGHLVQITPDQRLGGRGDVARRQSDRTDRGRHRPQHRPLGGLGDDGHPLQPALPALAQRGALDGEHREQHAEHDPHGPVEGLDVVVPLAGQQREADGCRPHHRRTPRRGEQAGHDRAGREDRDQLDAGAQGGHDQGDEDTRAQDYSQVGAPRTR